MTADTNSAARTHEVEGECALREGRILDAEKSFRAALAQSPNSISANYNLGLIQLERGKASDGLPHLQRAAKVHPTTDTLTSLGICFETLGNAEQAVRCYRPVLNKTPENSSLWSRYARLQDSLGQRIDAAEAYKTVLKYNPGDTQAAIKLAWILWPDDPKEAIQTLQATINTVTDKLEDRVKLLSVLVLFKEWFARLECGMPPYHAASMDDLFFNHAADTFEKFRAASAALAERGDSDSWTSMTNGLAVFASGEVDQAQSIFSSVTDEVLRPMAQAIRFDSSFFDELEATVDEDLSLGLPVVETLKAATFSNSDILYMACNSTYFDMFAKPLLRSLANKSQKSEVHIHLMDSSPDHSDSALRFCSNLQNVYTALSVERPDFSGADLRSKRAYFHAIRFIRYYHHFKHYQRSLWLMDVDGLFNRSPDSLFSDFQDADVCLRARPGRLEPWNQFNACLVGSRPTSTTVKYLHRVAAYIAYFYREDQLPWGIDQLAMYASFLDLQKRGAAPKLGFLNETILDYEYREDSVLWCSSGVAKHTSSSGKTIDQDPYATDYDRAFSRFASHDDSLDPSEKSV